MRIRKRVIYRGEVQGVGFRATCHSIASRHQVGGHVRNCADGSVELVVEGEAPEVAAMLEDIAQRMEGYIREASAQDEPPREERDFRITR